MPQMTFPFMRDGRRLPAVPHCPYCGCAHQHHYQFIECCGAHGGYDMPDERAEKERARQAIAQHEK